MTPYFHSYIKFYGIGSRHLLFFPNSHLIYLPTYLPIYLPTYLPTNLLTYLATYLPTYLLTYLAVICLWIVSYILSIFSSNSTLLCRKLPNVFAQTLLFALFHSSFRCKRTTKSIFKTFVYLRREPWSSGYGWRHMFCRPWVQIPAPYTGWTFLHLFVVKIVMFVWKDENKIRRGRG